MKYLKPVFKGVKKPIKLLKVFLKQKAGWLDIPKIVPYKGYGNEMEVFIQGMVIEDKGLAKPKDRQLFWQNMLATIKRFASDEIPGVKVKAELLGKSLTTETDEMGYFFFHFKFKNEEKKILLKKWHTVHFELLDKIVENQPHTYATGEVRIIPSKQSRIIVSDIDDTVLISHSTQTLRKLRLMLFKNALTRLPFPSVAKFYEALNEGKDKQEDIPFFFVSSSEWNLYDLLDDFFSFNNIPKGVLLLRKLNHSIYKFWKSGGGSHEHKYEKIKSLINFYPEHKFILIGDSGQQDPELYTKIALEFPGKIKSIYIRRIRSKSYMKNNVSLIEELQKVNTTYLEVSNTHAAAQHASEQGYLEKEWISEI